jgi:hypothetical protein
VAQLAGITGTVRYRVTAPMLFRVTRAAVGAPGEEGAVVLQRLPLAMRGAEPPPPFPPSY